MSRSPPLPLLLLALAALLCTAAVYAQTNCGGQVNNQPIYTNEPTLLRTVENGKLYMAGQGDDSIYLLHVYGTPYQWGKATGQLMKNELHEMINTYFSYLTAQVDVYLKYLPEDVKAWIALHGIEAALDLTYLATKHYTAQRFEDEAQGLADGSGVPKQQFIRLNMLPELVKAGCTIVGAWGNATASNGGSLVQLRALDWDWQAPIKKWPAMVVYHPNSGDGHAFSNIGWPGMFGTIGTGYSAAHVGLSEKVWLTDASYDTRFGAPWTYVLRDVLQYAGNVDDALNILDNANRTCSVHVGVGDGKNNEFRGIEYSHKYLNIYDDENQPTYPAHPRLSGLVYWDKHKQPSNDPCLGSLMTKWYGQLDAMTMFRQVTAVEASGDTQVAVYDYGTGYVYVSYPAAEGESGPPKAYQRAAVRFDMNKLLAESL